MTQPQSTISPQRQATAHWAIKPFPKVLDSIHDSEINIAIWEREHLSTGCREVDTLLSHGIKVQASGQGGDVLREVATALQPHSCLQLLDDIRVVLQHFQEVTQTQQVRLLLATVDTNMCRRFHADINDIRLLCTYAGPGTQWLTDDNINTSALQATDDGRPVFRDERLIRRVPPGAVVLLKGAMYPHPGAKAVVHRSPPIENDGRTRLLLRIDTNETMNLWG